MKTCLLTAVAVATLGGCACMRTDWRYLPDSEGCDPSRPYRYQRQGKIFWAIPLTEGESCWSDLRVSDRDQ